MQEQKQCHTAASKGHVRVHNPARVEQQVYTTPRHCCKPQCSMRMPSLLLKLCRLPKECSNCMILFLGFFRTDRCPIS